MSESMKSPIGLRVKMRFGDPDPGRERFQLPGEPATGVISGLYIGRHGRTYYYVTLDDVLVLDTDVRAVQVIKGKPSDDLSTEVPRKGPRRWTNVVSIAATQDVPAPPRDLLGPALVEFGRGVAELANLIFRRPLPPRVELWESQEDARRPLEEADYVDIGYADVEVV